MVLRLPPAIVKTPGAYYRILKQLAWENINLIDGVSTYTEFTIVLDDTPPSGDSKPVEPRLPWLVKQLGGLR
jgi:hypothetical protein